MIGLGQVLKYRKVLHRGVVVAGSFMRVLWESFQQGIESAYAFALLVGEHLLRYLMNLNTGLVEDVRLLASGSVSGGEFFVTSIGIYARVAIIFLGVVWLAKLFMFLTDQDESKRLWPFLPVGVIMVTLVMMLSEMVYGAVFAEGGYGVPVPWKGVYVFVMNMYPLYLEPLFGFVGDVYLSLKQGYLSLESWMSG